MELKEIDIETISYANYRAWLEKIAYKKKLMLEAAQRKREANAEIRKLEDKIRQFSSVAYKASQEEEAIRQELVEALPSKF